VSEHSNMAPTTQWERAGFGWWRWLRGVKLTVTERTRTAEVDGRHLSSSAPVMWCADLDTEDAQAWCEGWALRVASLFPGRATEAGEAREGGDAMDASERARLRALREGIALPWEAMEDHYDDDGDGDGDGPVRMVVLCPHGDTDDRDTVATIDMGHGEECDTAHAALIVGAVNALGPLLDALERAERERGRDTAWTAGWQAVRAAEDGQRERAAKHIGFWKEAAKKSRANRVAAEDEVDRLTAALDEARAEAERLREQVRVWRTLAREGSIASADLGVIGPDEAALALARCARRASEHAAQGAEAAREACIKLCDGIAARWETERAAGCSDVARAAAGGTAAGALLCADAIRARGGGA